MTARRTYEIGQRRLCRPNGAHPFGREVTLTLGRALHVHWQRVREAFPNEVGLAPPPRHGELKRTSLPDTQGREKDVFARARLDVVGATHI